MSNRTRSSRSARATLIPAMPDRTVSFLMLTAGAIFALYVVLVIVTITFAAAQTSLAAEVRTTEGTIAGLESSYYERLAAQSAESPSSIGLVKPAEVQYAVAQPAASLTFARK